MVKRIVCAALAASAACGAAAEDGAAVVRVDLAAVKARVPRTLYGTGMEDVNHEIYGGLDAQRLYLEGFEAAPPTNRPARVAGGWTPVARGRGAFDWSEAVHRLGRASQVLEPNGDAAGVANMGLNDWGVPAREGKRMLGHVYVRGRAEALEFALERYDGRKVYATNRVERVDSPDAWRKVTFALVPRVTDPMARLRISAVGEGRVWIDDASLVDEPTNRFGALGCREDIVEALRRQGLTFLRWGGSMVNVKDYLYRHMTGERTFYRGMWSWWSSYAFMIPEFVRMAAEMKVACAFSINAYEPTEDAVKLAAWLKAFDIPLYVQIGNEECAGYNPYCGKTDLPSVRRYGASVRRLVAAMRAEHPKLRFVNAVMWKAKHMDVMEEAFRQTDGFCDYWDVHVGCSDAGAGRGVRETCAAFRDMVRRLNPDSKMKLAIFEENGGNHDMRRALGHASVLIACREQGDFLLTSCPANALQAYNHNDNGWDQGQVFFTPDKAWLQPCGWAQAMASAAHRDVLVESAVEGRAVEVSATRDDGGRSVVLHVVNGAREARRLAVDLGGGASWTLARAVCLAAASPTDHNPPDDPERVRPRDVTEAFRRAPQMPAKSYLVLTYARN